LVATITEHQRVPPLVTLAAMVLNVIVDVSLERCDQDPPCTLARNLVQP
jgi:hypothetical protein